jgi:hypothetical protein
MARPSHVRLDELLLTRATEGLDAAESAELERLLAAHPHTDEFAYDRAAAAVCLAVFGGAEMPRGLKARLEEQLATGRPKDSR